MVSAVLHFRESDGTILPPRTVTLVGPCEYHRAGGCIEVATLEGDAMFVSPDELEAVEPEPNR